MDFTGGRIRISFPGTLESNIFPVIVLGDEVFEPQEYFEVILNLPILMLPEPFKSIHTNVTGSIIDPPGASNILLRHSSTVIVIQGGNVSLHLYMYNIYYIYIVLV